MIPSHLDAWRVEDPPPGFADRVAANALGLERRRFSRRAAFGWVAVAACTAFAVLKTDRVLRAHVGELTAKVRSEVELAPGVIATLERGARLLWDQTGIRQERGDVSYRVAPQVTLDLQTALGRLHGLGSCCRVKLAEATGTITALFVSLSRGALDVDQAAERATLHQGQYARVTSLAIVTDADDATGEIARELDLPRTERSRPIPPEHHADLSLQPPLTKRSPERPAHSHATSGSSPAGELAPPSADAGARATIVPSCFCDRGDSLCACFQ